MRHVEKLEYAKQSYRLARSLFLNCQIKAFSQKGSVFCNSHQHQLFSPCITTAVITGFDLSESSYTTFTRPIRSITRHCSLTPECPATSYFFTSRTLKSPTWLLCATSEELSAETTVHKENELFLDIHLHNENYESSV